ncbi:hypothetical protein KW830_02455 [Comamonas sp. CMM03]|uniref:hypothetical protein n=1 Tax=Comamonas sp. CMM03 TaxID=2854781 RepID=UPI001C45FAB4|nr:hypothetical protein [Comamonas sp. CMM03]MBV7417309.1 hypothetical protein [Comamonas sp. CMM03]
MNKNPLQAVQGRSMKGWRKFFYIVDKGSDLLLMFAAVFIYYALGIGLLISGFFLFFRWVIRPTGLRSDFPRLIAQIYDLTIQSIDKITDLFHQFIETIAGIPDTLRQLSLETFTQFISGWLTRSGFAPSTHVSIIAMAGLTIIFLIVLQYWPLVLRQARHPLTPRWLDAAWARTGGPPVLDVRCHEKSLYRRNLLR